MKNREWVIYCEDYKILSCNLHHNIKKLDIRYPKYVGERMKLRAFKSIA